MKGSPIFLWCLGTIGSVFADPYNFPMKSDETNPAQALRGMTPAKRQVFIVDDDVSVCRALRLLLITYGYSVKTYGSAELFLSEVKPEDPGCLIIDIHMPGMDGWQVLANLQRSGAKRPAIIISAEKKEGLQEKSLKAGAVGFLQKPFNDEELVALLESGFQG